MVDIGIYPDPVGSDRIVSFMLSGEGGFDSLEDVADKAADAAAEAIDDVEIDLDALEDMTVAALKEKLKEVGLPVTGKKADLIKRLVDKLTEVEA